MNGQEQELPVVRKLLPAIGLCLALAACGPECEPKTIECVNITSHERLVDTDQQSPDGPFSFTGTDWQGYRRFISLDDRKWWKCRSVPVRASTGDNQ